MDGMLDGYGLRMRPKNQNHIVQVAVSYENIPPKIVLVTERKLSLDVDLLILLIGQKLKLLI